MQYRIGQGFDVHAFAEGRSLFLGGVKIEHSPGLLGHSDADVLLHAICDALLGALALGDIGIHFPNTSPEFKDIDSAVLLERTGELIRKEGWHVSNLDATLVLEKPKIKEYVPEMRARIAGVLKIEASCVSIKATTTEKLGFTGREEGIAAMAIAMLSRAD